MTQRSALRLFLVGLPVGLAASILVALYLYYHPIELRFPGRAARPAAADLIRKSPTGSDLLDYRRILRTELPDPSSSSPQALNATANWLASTLGPTNLGLPVKIQNVGINQYTGQNIVVELPGRKNGAEVIVVCTSYDANSFGLDSASSTALLMTLANAFVGLPQQRTVVFAFLCRDQFLASQKSGIEALLANLHNSGRSVRGAIDVRVQAVPETAVRSLPQSVSIEGISETLNDRWATEAWQALTTRAPSTASLARIERAELERRERAEPRLSNLTWWRQTAAPPVPFLVLLLHPATGDDTGSVLALARSLEGVVQALANR